MERMHGPWTQSAIKVFLAKNLKAPLLVIKGTAFYIVYLFLLFMTNPSECNLESSREENEQIEVILVMDIIAVPQKGRCFVRFNGTGKIVYPSREFK